ncbi:MAG: hypothetical protein C7B43_20210 [Sulfobacillus benefaciens]|uniref:Uncharacterized protein n=1 Tax=Sulfobacillus benefaciens TaxID=453960 RepID=A0A2T2WM52_9FIRM|nr:MAG: hypothetical protein C7B43_20210 [Sulfobacillus benefaciens]
MADDEKWTVRIGPDLADMVRTFAKQKGQSLNQYMQRALTNQIQVDAVDWPTGHLGQVVEQGTEKTTVAANFAAIQAQAVLILLKEWRKEDMKRQEGLPEELARQTVQCDVDDAIAESIRTFEDPRVRQQYAWVERPQSADDLPDWFTNSGESEEYDDLTDDEVDE